MNSKSLIAPPSVRWPQLLMPTLMFYSLLTHTRGRWIAHVAKLTETASTVMQFKLLTRDEGRRIAANVAKLWRVRTAFRWDRSRRNYFLLRAALTSSPASRCLPCAPAAGRGEFRQEPRKNRTQVHVIVSDIDQAAR